jgi:hypothetical protein
MTDKEKINVNVYTTPDLFGQDQATVKCMIVMLQASEPSTIRLHDNQFYYAEKYAYGASYEMMFVTVAEVPDAMITSIDCIFKSDNGLITTRANRKLIKTPGTYHQIVATSDTDVYENIAPINSTLIRSLITSINSDLSNNYAKTAFIHLACNNITNNILELTDNGDLIAIDDVNVVCNKDIYASIELLRQLGMYPIADNVMKTDTDLTAVKSIDEVIEDIMQVQVECGGRFMRSDEIKQMSVLELLNLLVPNNVRFNVTVDHKN